MKYIRLFENFEEGHKFDLLDLFIITPKEVKELFFRELNKRNPDLENIQVFLDSGLVDVNAKDNYDRTPLHMAAGRNSLALAKLLISSGAEVEAKDNMDKTPLHWAAGGNSLEVAELLISSGADVNAKDNNGDTPLHFTKPQEFYHRYEGVIELLISSGADEKIENNDGETYLDVED